MSKTVRKWPKVGSEAAIQLDEQKRISLDQVIKCFNYPISEEHAWAIIYQTVRTLNALLQTPGILSLDSPANRDVLVQVSHSAEILLHQDGVVADETFLVPKLKSKNRNPVLSENKVRPFFNPWHQFCSKSTSNCKQCLQPCSSYPIFHILCQSALCRLRKSLPRQTALFHTSVNQKFFIEYNFTSLLHHL